VVLIDGYSFDSGDSRNVVSGVVVGDGSLVLELYYIQNTVFEFIVEYDGNGSTDGVVPIDLNNPYIGGSSVTVLGQGDLIKEDYVFLGWSTESTVEVAEYVEGDSFTIQSNTVLFAIWFLDEVPPLELFEVRFLDWDGIVLKNEQVAYGDDATPPEDPIRDGYTFTGWSGSYTNIISDIDVTAQYTLIHQEPTTYAVIYDAAGGSGAPTGGQYDPGVTVTVASGVPTRSGYTFAGWLYNGVTYNAGQTFTMPETDVTLVAQWTQNSNSGGSTSPSPKLSTKVASPTPSPSESDFSLPSETPSIIPPPVLILQTWALVNLILSVAGIVFAVLILIVVLVMRKKKNEQNNKPAAKNQSDTKYVSQYSAIWLCVTIVLGILGIIVFLLTEDMNLTMALVDNWSIVNAIIFIVEIIAIVLIFKRKKIDTQTDGVDDDDDDDDTEGNVGDDDSISFPESVLPLFPSGNS
ncbi:MAG: InlB B-repeat-containing protein, partial [Candidatus Bathyarchaeota archaeon]|nr:InlB B-repeat-containing protein [Candidatus Termiticorpusculum sp.]